MELLFKNENNCGVDSLNAIAFVVQSGLPRLNTAQQYIFDSIMKLFGKGIANNFLIVATFADAGDPQVLSAIREAQIPVDHVSKFNNSALYAKCTGNDGRMNKFFWEIGKAGYKNIFDNINRMEPKSLTLTTNVLDERKKLHVAIDGLSMQIRIGIAKMNEIEKEIQIIDQYKREIKANKNFTTIVKIMKSKKIDLEVGEYVTNCSKCNKTCHYPCRIPKDEDKYNCAAMNEKGTCTVCGCHWKMHFNMPYRWELYEVEETRTLMELKQKYGDAKSKKQSEKKMLQKAESDYEKIWELTTNLVNECRKCVLRLEEIALRPIPLSEIDYLKLQITGEKQRALSGWEDRVEWYEELIKQQELIVAISKGNENQFLPHQKIQNRSQGILNFLCKKIGIQLNF